jgi:uncharacterized phage protein gp47/JayE
MPTLAEFKPLRDESIDSIRARIDSGVNAGLDPADPLWRDTTPGGFFYDHTQALGLEAELLWDFASLELPASFLLPFSWGIYLDYWGELLDVPRKDAAAALGEVTFTNTTSEAVLVGTNTQVAAESDDPDEEPLAYLTTTDVTLDPAESGTVPVVAADSGTQYNVAEDAVVLMLSPVPGIVLTNEDAISGGADVEEDEPYKRRLLLEFSSARGGGTADDYLATGLARPNVGHVVVEPRWAGAGTVRLVLRDPQNNPLSTPALEAEQDFWDPVGAPGDGEGEAPINHVVTVATVALLNVVVAATVKLLAGFSLDGAGATENVSDSVIAAIRGYIDTLDPGEDVQRNRVMSAIIEVPGVHDVTALTLDGSATDRAVAALQVARVSGTPALTAAP